MNNSKINFYKEDSLKKRYLYKLGTKFIGFPIGLITAAIIPRGLGLRAYGDYNFSGAQLVSDMPEGPFNLKHSIDTFSNALGVTTDNFNSIGVPIHLITQPPHQKYSPQSVYFSIFKGFGSIESFSVKRTDFDKLNEIPINAFYKYESNINIYNITDLYCDEFLCLIGEKEKSFYYDNNHLSSDGAIKLEKIIEEILWK